MRVSLLCSFCRFIFLFISLPQHELGLRIETIQRIISKINFLLSWEVFKSEYFIRPLLKSKLDNYYWTEKLCDVHRRLVLLTIYHLFDTQICEFRILVIFSALEHKDVAIHSQLAQKDCFQILEVWNTIWRAALNGT